MALTPSQILDRRLQLVLAGNATVEERLAGGARATGKIVFTANPTAGHTITVGNKTLTFRASADANLDEVTIETTLSATIDNIITKLGTYSTGAVTLCIYTKTDTNKGLTATTKNLTAAYNDGAAAEFALASSNANGVVTAMSGGVAADLSLDHKVTLITDTETSATLFELPAGEEGQEKVIVLGARTNAVSPIVYPQGGSNITSITFSAANKYAKVMYLGGKWRNIGGDATFA